LSLAHDASGIGRDAARPATVHVAAGDHLGDRQGSRQLAATSRGLRALEQRRRLRKRTAGPAAARASGRADYR